MDFYENLLSRIKLVRRRWRSQVLVKGISLFVASTIALLVIGVWGADLFGFRPAAIWGMRLLTGGVVLFVAWYFLAMPLRARLGDLQIAQYIEERYPQLEDRLVTAVEYGKKETASSGIIDLLIRDALDKTSRVDFSVFVNRKRLAYFGLLGVSALLALFALLNWGPSFFPYGFNQLYVPWTEASFGSSMSIKVLPGDLEIPKGSDQQIEAQLIGFDSPEVQLYLQPEGSNSWDPSTMEPNPRGSSFRYLLLDIRSSLRYYVEAKGVRSRIHSFRVLDLAKVEKIGLTYTFPAYTGMASQSVENQGDISALKGTRIDLRVHLSRSAESARLMFDNQSALELSKTGAQDFAGGFSLQRSGSYVVQITDAGGKKYKGSSEYEMEALDDAPPKVTITRPMRDVRATNVEEVFSEIKAEDDIGIGKLELRYSVNGGPEKIAGLYGGNPPDKSVTRAHTFFLEEFGLEPGDVISYYGKAWDNNNVTGPGVSDSDIYFIEVRPFEQRYKQSQQAPQGGGQGGEGQEVLSRRQKEIISATFKLIRDKEHMASKEYLDGLKALVLVQSRLQADTQGLVDRFKRRGVERLDENFRKLSEYLKTAIGEMGQAAVALGAEKPDTAMPNEQKSLQQLMRAESLFREIQVSFAAMGGGSNSSSQANAEDLADLFELELNKLKNQYETVQRGEQQQRDQEVDEALKRLKELAQRQQQLNDRNRMLSQQAPAGSSSGSGSQGQEQLMREAEQLRRQLQRLSRERSFPDLNEAGSQLQKALEEMKKALNASQQGKASEANAQGLRALQQLNDAHRKLARGQQSGLKQGIEQANEESRKLVEEQNRIQQELDQLAREKESGPSAGEKERREDLIARKSNLSDRVKNLDAQIQDLSRQARKAQKEAGNKLADASGTIRDKRLSERIRNGNSLIQNGFYESQKQSEQFIRQGLEEVNKQLESARNSLGQTKEDKLEEAANRARQLSEGLESIQQRLNQNPLGQQQNRQNQRGQSGRQGNRQQAQGGRPGQSGQAQGQPNEQGRPGGAQQNPMGGRLSPQSDVRGPSGDATGAPEGMGRYRDEDVRQLQRELQQRLMDAGELRRLLDRNATETENLDRVIDSLRRAGDYQDYRNLDQIAKLKEAIDHMREVEFGVARDLDRLNQKERYFFSEDNEAPAAYQKLVEEYYKAIARTK